MALEASELEIKLLRTALEANRKAQDGASFARTDLAFHRALSEVGGNAIFVSLSEALNDWLTEQRLISARSALSLEVYAEHEAIFDAVASRDPARAQTAMQRHLEAVAERYWRAMVAGRPDRTTGEAAIT